MADYELGVKVKTSSDDAALKQTQEALEKLQAAQREYWKGAKDRTEALSKETAAQKENAKATEENAQAKDKGTGASDRLAGGLKRLVQAAVAMFAFQKVKQFLEDAFSSAIEGERVLRQLATTVEAVGAGSKEQAANAQEWVLALDRVSGVAKEDLVPAFNKFMAATKDTEASMALVQTAVGLSKAGFGEFSEIVSNLSMVMAGMPVRGQGAVAVMLRQAQEAGKLDEKLQELIGTYGDAGAALDDNATKADQNRQAWANTKEAIGGALTSLSTALRPVFYGLAMFIGMLEGGVIKLIGKFQALGPAFQAVGKAMTLVAAHDLKGAWAALEEGQKRIDATLEAASDKATKVLEDIDAAWDLGQGAIAGKRQREQQSEKALAAAKYAREKADREKAAKEAQAAREKEEKAEAEHQRKLEALERAAAERKRRSRLLLARIKQDIRQEEEKAEKKAAADQAKLYAENAARVRRIDNLVKATKHRSRVDDLKDLRHALGVAIMEEAKSAADVIRIRKAIAAVDKQIRQTQKEQALGAAADMIGAAEAVFGQSKATGYAMAIVNALMAFNNQLSQGDPWTAWVRAAAALASGMATAAKIESTDLSKGSGFDDPTNDAAARMGGLRWAKDMTREFTIGVSKGWAEAMSQARVDRRHISTVNNTSTDNRRSTTNVHLSQQLLTGAQGKTAYKELEWSLRPARRDNDRLAAGSPRVRVGKRRQGE